MSGFGATVSGAPIERAGRGDNQSWDNAKRWWEMTKEEDLPEIWGCGKRVEMGMWRKRGLKRGYIGGGEMRENCEESVGRKVLQRW